MDETQTANQPTCAACGQDFDWEAAYRAQNTPGSVPYNPPGHGVFRPRAYCPHCGALVAEWHIDRSRDFDEWAWYGDNAALNGGRPLPPNPLLAWGKGIPTALLPTIDEHALAVEKIKQLEGSTQQKAPESTTEAVALAQQAGQLLNQGELEKASQHFEQAAAAGLNRRDQALAFGAVGLYYLWKRSDVEQAFLYCRRGEEIDPSANWQMNYVLSLIYAAAGDFDKAKQELADAHRFAGTVWWDGGVDGELKANLNQWLGAHGKEALRAIVFPAAIAGAGSAVDASALTAAAAPGGPDTAIVDTKICPSCGQQIKLEAKLCRYCRARFELMESGYCSNCHAVVQAGPDGKCPDCQRELIDRHVESQLVLPPEGVAPSVAAAAKPGTEPPQVTAQLAGSGKKPAAGVLTFWQLYFLPNGRIDRKTFFLEGFLPLAALMGLVIWVTLSVQETGIKFLIQNITFSVVILLVLTWVLLMLMVKRLHDLGTSGWSMLIWLVLLMSEPVANLLEQDTSAVWWIILGLFGLLLFVVQLLRCIFAPGKAYFNRYGQETGFQSGDASSLTVKDTLRRRRLTGAIVIAVVLTPLVIFSAVRYLFDQNNLKRGLQAYGQADCAVAMGYFDNVLDSWRLADFGNLEQSAEVTKETCQPFQAAVDQQTSGDYAAALAGFAALALDDPDSILGQAAQARITALFEGSQTVELDSAAACDRLAGLKAANLVPHPETRLPEMYMFCADAYQKAGAGNQAVKMYQQMLVDFPDQARAKEAETALLSFPAACEQTVMLANEPAIVARRDFLPRYYFSCGKIFDKNKSNAKAFDMYKRLLIEYPAHSLAAEAEAAVLANPMACSSAETLQREAAVSGRAGFMPQLFYNCGASYEKDKSFSQAVVMYEAFIKYYPDHSLAEAVNTALARALVNAARAAGAGEIAPPQKSGSTGSGETLVVIQNDSPERLRIVFSGPESMIMELAACSSCTTWSIRPFSCPEEGPIGRYSLPAGEYDVLVESISDSGVTPFTGDWELVGGDEYYSCFYILKSFRYSVP